MTVGEALALARGRIAANDARILLREATGLASTTLVAHPERAVDAVAQAQYLDWLARREMGEPIAYLIGWREFYGRRFGVTPATLIPRPDTELLVECALTVIKKRPGATVLDLGTGSGAIAISLALEAPQSQVMAVDASAAALAVAKQNAASLGAQLGLLEGDWYAPVEGERFDCIVSNPPYVAEGDVHLGQGDVRFEPVTALTAGADGLNDIRVIVSGAMAHLTLGGWLLCEHGYDQASACRQLLIEAGFGDVRSWRDLAGVERVSGGRAGASFDDRLVVQMTSDR